MTLKIKIKKFGDMNEVLLLGFFSLFIMFETGENTIPRTLKKSPKTETSKKEFLVLMVSSFGFAI